MRSKSSSHSWASLMARVGLAVACFSQLSRVALSSLVPSDQLLRLASMLSANFSNVEEVREEIANGQPTLGLININLYPVHVPMFDPEPTFYAEEIANGQIVRRYIDVLSEDDIGLVHVQLYTMKSVSDQDWTTTNFQTLTQDDLNYLDGCDSTYYEIDDGIFFGEVPDCVTYPPEGHKSYPVVITCDVLGFLMPAGDILPEKPSHVPFQFRPITRYTLLPYSYAGVDNYENTCL